jgi:hypothetical protein
MSLLTHLRRKRPEEVAVSPRAQCPHSELAPRWDSVEDMGKADRVMYYTCTTCGARVAPDDAASRIT